MTEAAQKKSPDMMIRSAINSTWQRALADAVTNVHELLAAVGLTDPADELGAMACCRNTMAGR